MRKGSRARRVAFAEGREIAVRKKGEARGLGLRNEDEIAKERKVKAKRQAHVAKRRAQKGRRMRK